MVSIALGKSTILNLFMASSREYQGEILCDGKRLRDISPESPYELISIIQQKVFVLNRTIRENITMFSAPPEKAERAIRLFGLNKLLAEKGEAYPRGENGSGLSAAETGNKGRSVPDRRGIQRCPDKETDAAV